MVENANETTIDILEKEKTRCGCRKIDVYRTLTYYNILTDFFTFAASIYYLFYSKNYFIETKGSKEGERYWQFTLTINYILIPQHLITLFAFFMGIRWCCFKRHSRSSLVTFYNA